MPAEFTDPEQARFDARMRQIRAHAPQPIIDALRAAHAEFDWVCAAHAEGLTCCLDYLLGDADGG